MLKKLIETNINPLFNQSSLISSSKVATGWILISYFLVTDDAFINVVSPIFTCPYASWICPKILYNGLTLSNTVFLKTGQPALPPS